MALCRVNALASVQSAYIIDPSLDPALPVCLFAAAGKVPSSPFADPLKLEQLLSYLQHYLYECEYWIQQLSDHQSAIKLVDTTMHRR
jgi:hypothetical protein